MWRLALTRPSVETFERLAAAARPFSLRPYLAIFISTAIPFFLWNISLNLSTLLMSVLFRGVVLVLFFVVWGFATQWLAEIFTGSGSFPQLSYVTAAYLAPSLLGVSLIGLVLGGRYQPLLFSLWAIYALILTVIAVEAVNKVGWLAAILSVVIALILVLIGSGAILWTLSNLAY